MKRPKPPEKPEKPRRPPVRPFGHQAAEQEIQLDADRWGAFKDTFGEREHGIDADGSPIELLRLVRDFASVEGQIAERVTKLKRLDLLGVARSYRVEHDDDKRRPRSVLVSERIAGVRLSEIIAKGASKGVVPDIGASLYVMRRLYTAAETLRKVSGLDHFVLAPERVVVTPRGELVIVEIALAAGTDALAAGAALPKSLKLAYAESNSKKHALRLDIARIARIGVALLIGRAVDPGETIDALSPILGELNDVAAIRAGDAFSAALRTWLEQALTIEAGVSFDDFAAAASALDQLDPPKDCVASRQTFRTYLESLAVDELAHGDLYTIEADRIRSIRTRQTMSRSGQRRGWMNKVAGELGLPHKDEVLQESPAEIAAKPLNPPRPPAAAAPPAPRAEIKAPPPAPAPAAPVETGEPLKDSVIKAVASRFGFLLDEKKAGAPSAAEVPQAPAATPASELVIEHTSMTEPPVVLSQAAPPATSPALKALSQMEIPDAAPAWEPPSAPPIEPAAPESADTGVVEGVEAGGDVPVEEPLKRPKKSWFRSVAKQFGLSETQEAQAAEIVPAQQEPHLSAEEEARRYEAERFATAEAERAAESARRLAVEQEARRTAEAAVKRLAAEVEAQRRAEEEARRMAADASVRQRAAEAEARRATEEEARRLADEAEAKRKAEEEARRLAAEAEAKRAAAEAEARRLAAEAEVRRQAAEAGARRAAEERIKLEEQARRAAAEEAARIAAAQAEGEQDVVEEEVDEEPEEENSRDAWLKSVAAEMGLRPDPDKAPASSAPAWDHATPPVGMKRPQEWQPPPPPVRYTPSATPANAPAPPQVEAAPRQVTLPPPPPPMEPPTFPWQTPTVAPPPPRGEQVPLHTMTPSVRYEDPDALDEPEPSRLEAVRSGSGLLRLVAMLVVVLGLGAGGYWYWANSVKPGVVSVDSNPAGAEVFVDGQSRGMTPITLSLPPGTHALELRRRGASREISLDVKAGEQLSQQIDLTNIRAVGTLIVNSQPKGAKVIVDGKELGVTPLTRPDMTVGSHKVVLQSAQGVITKDIQIQAGGTVTIDEGIFSGWIAVFAPFDVQVYERKKQIGSTEQERIMISAGRHELEFVNNQRGFRDTKTVDVGPGATVAISIEKTEGTLRVDAPEGSEISIDGTRVGEAPLGEQTVTLGVREVSVKHPQLGEKKMSVTVTSAAPAEVKVEFTP